MKKILSLLLSLILLLSAIPALAASPAESLMDAAESLLFRTENVTLNGEATFSLDSAEFKSAKAAVIRDREDSFWQLLLHTPVTGLMEGDQPIDSGYTIIAHSEQVFVTEVRHPGVYKTGYIFPRTTLLRPSVQLDLMIRFARNLAEQADVLLGEGAVTAAAADQGGTEIHVVLDENVPDLVNTALTLAFQAVAERYFDMNYDQVSQRYMGRLADYHTPTRAILYTTEYLYLKNADITFTLDASGELQRLSGAAGAYLQSGVDGQHRLDVSFTLDVSGRGTSKVEPFDPEKEGLVPAARPGVPEGEPAPDEELEPQGAE